MLLSIRAQTCASAAIVSLGLRQGIKKARQECISIVGHGGSKLLRDWTGEGPDHPQGDVDEHPPCDMLTRFSVLLWSVPHIRETARAGWEHKPAATKAAHVLSQGLFAAHVDPESLQITPSRAR